MAKKKEVKAPIVYGAFVVVKQTVVTPKVKINLTDTKGNSLARQKVDFEVINLGPEVPKTFGLKVGDVDLIFQGTPEPIGTKVIESEVDGNSQAYLIFHYQSFIGKDDK